MKNIVMNTLKQAGFEVTEYINGILVSLRNRKISSMEVDTVLRDNLEIEVGSMSVSQGVFIGTVTWLE